MRFEIAGRPIGPGCPAYVIAEMSANHAGSFEEAAYLVRMAARAGVDAVKLQTYSAETLTIDAPTEWMTIGPGSPWEGQTLFQLYQQAAMPWDWQPELRRIALSEGTELFSSAFDVTSLEFLEEMGVPAHKIASFEIVDHELIAAVARTGKPLILSTGMAELAEIDEAVEVARANGADQIALLKCTSAYPSPPDQVNLRAIDALRERFSVPVGLSDHTLGIDVAVAAVARGADLVEKHFVRSRDTDSADSSFSIDLSELDVMVSSIRRVQSAVGDATFGPGVAEASSVVFRRSIFAIADIEQGEVLTRENIAVIRPGHGLEPKHLPSVLGRRASQRIARGEPVSWDRLS